MAETKKARFRIRIRSKDWNIIERSILDEIIAILIKYGIPFEVDYLL